VSERPYDRAAKAALIQLSAIAGYGRGRGVLELRHRTPTPGSRMRRRFVDVDDVDQAVILARRLAVSNDVYVGCALRHNDRGGGTRNDLAAAWVLWADCDGAQAAQRLARFDPPAAITLASGSGPNRHAFWPLTRPLDADAAERANRRLAHALAADPRCADPARIMRVAGTRNHKHRPAQPVNVDVLHPGVVYDPDELLRALPPLPAPARPPAPATLIADHDDPLLAISPRVYVPALVGAQLNADHKVSCPLGLHRDETPSLHAYPDPAAGWYCFGCRRGGSIYNLAGALWRLECRGREFIEIRNRLGGAGIVAGTAAG